MADNLKIGTLAGGVGAMVTLDSLGIKTRAVDVEPAHYSEMVELADGSVAPQGWLEAEWHLNGIRDAAWILLYAYRLTQSTELYIRSISEDGKTYKDYRTIMIWAEGPPVRDLDTNIITDFTIRFVGMVEQV